MVGAVRRIAAGAAMLVVLGYGGALGYLKLNETRLVYHPDIPSYESGRINPAPDSLHVEKVTFPAADSSKVAAWVIPAAGSDTAGMWILISHGNAGNITLTRRLDFYARLRTLGANLLAYDYRGFGESEKRPITEQGLYADAQGAYTYLRRVRGVPANRIIVFGHSLGSGVATELATHIEAAGFVVEGAYTAVDGMAQARYPYLPVQAIMANHFSSLARIDRVSMPKLFLHAVDDAVVPVAHGRALFAKAKEPKQMVETTGGHEDAYRLDPRYLRAFGDFVHRVAPGNGPAGESPPPVVNRSER